MGGNKPCEDVYCVGCEGVDCKLCKTALWKEGRTVGRCFTVQVCIVLMMEMEGGLKNPQADHTERGERKNEKKERKGQKE
jgi:hypothetical protein